MALIARILIDTSAAARMADPLVEGRVAPLIASGVVAVGIADLLTAVLAGRDRLTLIHYGGDFDIASEILDFEHRWVMNRGER